MDSSLINTKRFNYWLTGTGWAEATFANTNQTATFEVSYLNDPLSDLFEALNRLLSRETTLEKIAFAQEPGEHVLLLRLYDEEMLNIQILWNDEWEELAIQQKIVDNKAFAAVDKETVYTDTDTVENFCRIVCVGTSDLLCRTSLAEYKEKWRLYDFPMESYTMLRTRLKMPSSDIKTLTS